MYPWEHDVARKKWEFLQEKGYVSDRLRPDGSGLLFYKIDNPKDWGSINWWGGVLWGNA